MSSKSSKTTAKNFHNQHLSEFMNWMFKLTALTILTLFSAASAQSVIKILQFEKNTGIIDKGEDAGLHLGEVFDVNRNSGDFVYWIGRVEVVVVKPKVAGVKMLTQAENATIQPGDVLELRQRETIAAPEQKNPATMSVKKIERSANKIEPVELNDAATLSFRTKKVIFGLTTGLAQPIKSSSQSLGLNFWVQFKTSDDKTRAVDMTHAYTTSVGLQAYCTLPLSNRLSVNLSFDYLPLNVKSGVETTLLKYGKKASASLVKLGAALDSRVYRQFHVGLGAGLIMPQATVKDSRQSITAAERRLGVATNVAHFLPLGPAAWLKSSVEYDIFLDDGPAIHYLTLQTGLSLGIGKN